MNKTIGSAALLLCAAYSVAADTISDRASTDQVEMVASDDPHMRNAFAKAKATLDDFLQLYRNPKENTKWFSVKVGFSDDNYTEYFWIESFSENDGQFQGTVGNEPRLVKHITAGEAVTFEKSEIVDWLYLDTADNRMMGNFTACAMLRNTPPEEAAQFKASYGLECDD